jgi:Uncharacterized protein conserved in bacteria
MDVISSDKKTVGKVDHLEGTDKIKLTKQSSPDGQHHHFIPVSWVDHVDQHVHLNKSGADVTSHGSMAASKRPTRIALAVDADIIRFRR